MKGVLNCYVDSLALKMHMFFVRQLTFCHFLLIIWTISEKVGRHVFRVHMVEVEG